MLPREEEKVEAYRPPSRWRHRLSFRTLRPLDDEARALVRRYWHRDVWMATLLVLPLTFAFDQGIRAALLGGHIPVNLFTAFIVRPTLAYLAARSLLKWMRVDWKGFGAVFLTMVFVLDAKTFHIDEMQAVIATGLTGVALLIAEVLIEYGPEPKKKPLP